MLRSWDKNVAVVRQYNVGAYSMILIMIHIDELTRVFVDTMQLVSFYEVIRLELAIECSGRGA